MNRRPQNAKPRDAGRGAFVRESKGSAGYMKRLGQLYGKRPAAVPANWRDRLPDPATYYAQHIERLGKPNAAGWAQGRCPLHEDRHESLSVNVASARGGWKCFAGCGSGDLVAFHQRLTSLDFKAAVRDLLGLEVRA